MVKKLLQSFTYSQIYIATLPPPGGTILPIYPSRAPGSRTGPVLKRGDKMMASEPQDDYRGIGPLHGCENATLTARALTGIEWK